MNVLIVLAHPEPQSLNASLARAAAAQLTADGHDVVISDLYAMDWKSVADEQDFPDRANPDFLSVDAEQSRAHETSSIPSDIAAEQAKVAAADLIILQFPMWWFGMPAIMKGWFDRVFTRGFAYAPGRKYDKGLMSGKRALVSLTTGTSESTYAPDGIDGAMIDLLWPIHNGILRYTGFTVLEPHVVYSPRRFDDAERTAAIDRWSAELSSINERPELFFHSLSDYGVDERLRPEIEIRSGFQHRQR